MDNDENIDNSIDHKDGYGPLSQYMAEPSVSLYQYPDKVFFKLNLLETDEDTILAVTLEIPTEFKNSLFCQAIISYCYCDAFKELGDITLKRHIDLYKRYFSFLQKHDENCDHDKTWSQLVALGEDLPYTVIHEFLLYLSEGGTGSTSVSIYRSTILKPIKWAGELSFNTGNYNLTNGDKLHHYVKKNVLPEIKVDDVIPKPALSQLFSIDYQTGEELQCPYNDSQLVTNIRWFAHWYLNLMHERRLFLRKIMWSDDYTIYELLIKRLNKGEWAINSNPVKSMFGKETKEDKGGKPLDVFLEASGIYAKIYEALLPSKFEIEQIERNIISSELKKRLLWLEPLGFSLNDTKTLFNEITSYQSNTDEIISRITKCISYNQTYSLTPGKGGDKKVVPISLSSNKGRLREAIRPNFSLADMLVPTASESVVMGWLLASDCIQRSNQIRLKLSDLKRSERGKTLTFLTPDNIDDIDVNEAKIGHYKGRGKGKNVNGKGKNHETITYKHGDPIMTTYTNWFEDMTEAQIYLKKGKGNWFHSGVVKSHSINALFPLSFLCAKNSMLREAYEKSETQLKYHSELNGQGAFRWLLSAHIRHMAYVNTNKGRISEIALGADAVRQSRIIFNEGQDMTDAENAKETAHNEEMVAKYREAGIAKERIQNGLKGNVQVANKMVDEALSVLDSCHIMSVDEVQKSLHDPSRFTVNDVVNFINEIAATPNEYDVTIFGGIIDKNNPDSGIKIINDKNSAMMMWSYIRHMESELQSIEENHSEEQVVKHLFEHAQWSILFERFSNKIQQEAKALAEQYNIPYPPLF